MIKLGFTFCVALTSDLFDVLLPFFCGTKSDFLGEATPALGDKTAKLEKFLETTVQRNSLRGCRTQAVGVPQLLRGTSGIQPSETVQRTTLVRGLLQIYMESIMPAL
jgi:hypothetical protein